MSNTLWQRYSDDFRKCFSKDKIIHAVIIMIVLGIYAYYHAMQEQQQRQELNEKARQINDLFNTPR